MVDYLLKPFSYERFVKAVEKIKQPVQPPAADDPAYVVIKEKEGLLKIPHKDILYIEASRDYMKIVTLTRSYLTHITLKKLEELLPPAQFVRTHKSFIVALNQIRLLKTDSLVLMNNITVPVSNSYRDDVLAKFHK